MIRIKLPMPSPDLSPNARVHWARKSKVVKKHRSIAHIKALIFPDVVNKYQLHFVHPDKRRRDFDNFTARCKPYLDGIADAIGQDDSEWGMDAPTREVIKGESYIIITLT